MGSPAMMRPPCTDPGHLQEAITDMDGLAAVGFEEIAAIGQLALSAMENPHRPPDPEAVALALQAIERIADAMNDSIRSRALHVGCAFTDARAERRFAARRQHEMARAAPATSS